MLVIVVLLLIQTILFALVTRRLGMKLGELLVVFVGISLSLAVPARWLGRYVPTFELMCMAAAPMAMVLLGCAWGLRVARALDIHGMSKRLGTMLVGTLFVPALFQVPILLVLGTRVPILPAWPLLVDAVISLAVIYAFLAIELKVRGVF